MRQRISRGKNFERKDGEIRLFEKGRRGILRMVFGRTGIVILLLLLQVLVLFAVFQFLKNLIPYVFGTLLVFTIIMVVYVINTEHNATVKMSWIILIMLLPGFGGILYIFIQQDIGHRTLKKRYKEVVSESEKEYIKHNDLMDKMEFQNKGLFNLATYTVRAGGYQLYENSPTKYLSIGEDAFEEMIIQLEKAEKFIFMEYFIIDEGYMWGRILKILSDKVKQGVEVRLLYDGTCEFTLLPHNYPKMLEELGISCRMFAPIRPFISTHYNYRDHRKITVVDGRVAFTGGVNLADEYINEIEVYGHWKDTAIMIEGKAVNSFTLMFLQMWNMNQDERSYMTEEYQAIPSDKIKAGYALPFGDSPLDNDKVGQMIYMDIINRAESYVHIMTPYLIPDGEMLTALQFAAKRGVDVKIILPYIPDKKLVFAQTRSYYKELIKAGVNIYEYTPGFMHAKSIISDGLKGVVGTINIDYRSLYHHFECGLYIEGQSTVLDIEGDFNETLEKSHKVTLSDIRNHSFIMKIIGRILKLVAPLM